MQQKPARLIQRHNTAATWTSNNPILLQGELGFESDTSCLKIGDGVHHWENLPYITTNIPYQFYKAGNGIVIDTLTHRISTELRYEVIWALPEQVDIYQGSHVSVVDNFVKVDKILALGAWMLNPPQIGGPQAALIGENIKNRTSKIFSSIINEISQGINIKAHASNTTQKITQSTLSASNVLMQGCASIERIIASRVAANQAKLRDTFTKQQLLNSQTAGDIATLQHTYSSNKIGFSNVIWTKPLIKMTSMLNLINQSLVQPVLLISQNSISFNSPISDKTQGTTLYAKNNYIGNKIGISSTFSNINQVILGSNTNFISQSYSQGLISNTICNISKSQVTNAYINGYTYIASTDSTALNLTSSKLIAFTIRLPSQFIIKAQHHLGSSQTIGNLLNVLYNNSSLKLGNSLTFALKIKTAKRQKLMSILTTSLVHADILRSLPYSINTSVTLLNQLVGQISNSVHSRTDSSILAQNITKLIAAFPIIQKTKTQFGFNKVIANSTITLQSSIITHITNATVSSISQAVWAVLNQDSRPESIWSHRYGWLIIRQAERIEQNSDSTSSFYKMIRIY